MIPFLATLFLLHQGEFAQCDLPNPAGGPSLMYRVPMDPLPRPKLSPKQFGESKAPFEFDWLVPAYACLHPGDNMQLRFRVYAQDHRNDGELSQQVAQTLLRLYSYNYQSLGLDHSQEYNFGIVDVFLCYGGKAGGEQLFDQEVVNNKPIKVNTIYIYDLPSFTGDIERLREVAHEYGHASLPAVGGFQSPEDWANGYLGEKLYIQWLRNGMAKGWFTPRDTMGATQEELDGWLKTNVQPLVTRAATQGPEPALLAQTGVQAMNAYLGTALYMATILPDRVFSRSMKLSGSVKAPDYLTGISLAVEEQSSRLTIPAYLVGQKIWLPISDGNLSGAAILKRKGGWVQITANGGTITIVPKRTS